MHDGWDPSSAPYEATFTVGQTAGANGQVPRQRGWVQKKRKKKRETRERGRGRGRDRRSGCLYELSQDVGNAASAN